MPTTLKTPTPANRALVNRGIAESRGYHEITTHRGGHVIACKKNEDHTWTWDKLDYTRDLNACHDVCEERGLDIDTSTLYNDDGGNEGRLIEVCLMSNDCRVSELYLGTDLRWLVAMAVWVALAYEAAKREE